VADPSRRHYSSSLWKSQKSYIDGANEREAEVKALPQLQGKIQVEESLYALDLLIILAQFNGLFTG